MIFVMIFLRCITILLVENTKNASFQGSHIFKVAIFPKSAKWSGKIYVKNCFLKFLSWISWIYCCIDQKQNKDLEKGSIFQSCNYFIFLDFHLYIFCQFIKCNCMDKIVLDRFWNPCWQRSFSIKEMENFVAIPPCVFV